MESAAFVKQQLGDPDSVCFQADEAATTTNTTRTTTDLVPEKRSTSSTYMEPQVLKGGPRHQVLIAVQAPATGRAAHGAAATALKGSSSSERAPPKPQGTPPSFPLGVVISSSSSSTYV